LVLELLGLLECRLEHARDRAPELRLRAAGDFGDRGEHLLDRARELLERDAELLQHRHRAALGLPEQRAQEVRRLDLAVAARARERLGLADGLLTLDRELVETHGWMFRHGS